MAGNKRKKVVLSFELQQDIKTVFEYDEETFGLYQAWTFISEIYKHVWNLNGQYLMFPEVRFLPTKNKKYRNIIVGSYLVIYRIENEFVEVLRVFHASQCTPQNMEIIKKIKTD